MSKTKPEPTFNIRLRDDFAKALAEFAKRRGLWRGVAANILIKEGLAQCEKKTELSFTRPETSPGKTLMTRIRNEYARPLEKLADRLSVGRGVTANWLIAQGLRKQKLLK